MKKEAYKHNLPHFQQPGQAYFVTWILKNAVPPKAFPIYTQKLQFLKNKIELHKQNQSDKKRIDELKNEYSIIRKKYLKAYHNLLDVSATNEVDLSKPVNTQIILKALHFWNGKKLKNIAFSIMPNHVHWVLEVFENDDEGSAVFLQDIMQSVKRHTANKINKAEKRTGILWQKESFDTTIRDDKHLYNVVEYTLNNPVYAGYVVNRDDWLGNYLCEDF